MGELERVLKETMTGRKVKPSGGALSGLNPNTAGQSPAIVGREGAGEMGRVLDNIPKENCPSWLNGDCLLILSRFLEETFRNFQVNARPPSHIEPPFSAKPIDVFPAAPVAIGGGAGVAFVDLASFRIPRSLSRGEIWFAGQSAESAAAFADIAWQIMVGGVPLDPWRDIRIQIWEMVPPTPLCAPIHINAGETVTIRARSISGAAHSVLGRLSGWWYPTRSESGDEVKSTLVD